MSVKKRERFKRNTIAIVYDFDGTLTQQPMQEYTVLPQIKINPDKFWNKVKAEKMSTKGEEIVTYMRLMLELADQNKFSINKESLGSLAHKIKFYPGVTTYFNRINHYVRKKTKGKIHLKHYIISAGLKEILQKVKIEKHFSNIFASEYYYDHHGVAKFPLIIVNDTLKTQFLFRINKGKEGHAENINEHMPLSARPIPFPNILYIGDGLTDVPCMTVTTKQGGYAIAVYKPGSKKGLATCKKLLGAGRVELIAKANYRNKSDLDFAIKSILDTMIQGIRINSLYFSQYLKYLRKK